MHDIHNYIVKGMLWQAFSAEQPVVLLIDEVDKADIGPSARACEPHIEQLIIAAGKGFTGDALERRLYAIRKQASHRLRSDTSLKQCKLFYICSLSTKAVCAACAAI